MKPAKALHQNQEVSLKRLALFLFHDNPVLLETANGVTDALEKSGVLKTYQITIDMNNGQNYFYTAQPVEETIKEMRELFPRAKQIGIVWNPGEAYSETCTMKAREVAEKYHFNLGLAKEYGIQVPQQFFDRAERIVK